MSFNRNNGLQNILDDTFQRFFTNSTDVSFNYLQQWANDPIFISLQTEPQTQQPEIVEEETDSIPDLIDPLTGRVENENAPVSTERGIQLWANLLEDYNSQIRMYQENVRTILDITRTFLPVDRNQTNTNSNSNSNSNSNTNMNWRDLLRNNAYTIDIESILPNLFSTNTTRNSPTQNEILYATTIFNYDISNNELTSNICPISLEEFHNGESLTRINHCGHVFRSTELGRWFIRNAHCPSCRYDIRHNR